MAWNEPGGGRDPWGNSGDQGPPDLDEAFKKLQAQFAGIFGRRRGGGRDKGSGGGISTSLLGLGLAVLAIVYGLWGLYQVDQGERGVVFRFGAVQQSFVMPGLHWNPPIIDRVEKVNVTQVRSKKHQALMLTEDENIVDVSMTVQYVVDDPVSFLVRVRNPEVSLDHATESALRHVVGGSIMDQVITDGRAAIAIEVQERLQSYLNRVRDGNPGEQGEHRRERPAEPGPGCLQRRAEGQGGRATGHQRGERLRREHHPHRRAARRRS